MKKKIISIALALVMIVSIIPFGGMNSASAATSSAISSALSGKLPLATRATPISGASKVYAYSSSSLSSKYTGYYIDTFIDQVVVTQISSDGRAVYVAYPSSSSSTGYRSLWFATDDIFGIGSIDVAPYTAPSYNATYCLASASSTKSYGNIDAKDACVKLGSRSIGGTTYYPTVYPISSQTINRVGGVKYKLALSKSSPVTTSLQDVTTSFAGGTITLKSVQNGRYVSADTSLSGSPAVANRTSASTWERFQVYKTSDNWVGFKSLNNGKYLSARTDVSSDAPLRATASALQAWECFRIYKKGNDYYIKSQNTGKYITARIDMTNCPLQARGAAASDWERFQIVQIVVITPTPTPVPNANALVRPITGKDAGYASDNGLDIAAPVGSPVYAVADATIEYSEYGHTSWRTAPDTAYSVNIKLDTPITINGTTYRNVFYTHMSKLKYSKTDGSSTYIHVKKGDLLGYSGMGNKNAHLHITFYTDRTNNQKNLSMQATRELFQSYLNMPWTALTPVR